MSTKRKSEPGRRADESYDTIRINDLVLPVSLCTGAQWALEAEEPIEQPVSISLSIFYDVSEAAQSDNLEDSINYVGLAHWIRDAIILKQFICLQDLSRCICKTVTTIPSLSHILDGLEIYVSIKQLKAPLHTKTVAIEHFAQFSADGSWTAQKVTHRIEDLVGPAIIGVRVEERLEKQDVVINLSIDTADKGLDREDWIDVRAITRMLYEEICLSNFLTLEALTSYIASETLSVLKLYKLSPTVSVRIAKPSALPLARSSEVEVIRTSINNAGLVGKGQASSSDFENVAVAFERSERNPHTVAIALGSNLGDSFRNIEYALRLLEVPREILGNIVASLDLDPFIDVVDTSFLYESAPMYVTDQPSFINCACRVETNLSPTTLLRVVKEIESIVGRVPSIRNGPRAVDLDIIFYDDAVVDTRSTWKNSSDLEGELVVPHPLLQEREFVLRPLNDMIADYIHPILKKSVQTLLNELYDPTAPPMNQVIPYPRLPVSPSLLIAFPSIAPVPETLTYWSYTNSPKQKPSFSQDTRPRKTHVMATLNVTPDSFSDGAKHDAIPAAMQYVWTAVAAGATIVDVGGYSTRPGAAFVSGEEEINRVVPAIKVVRDADLLREFLAKTTSSMASSSNDDTDGRQDMSSDDIISRTLEVPISVDTFRWEVAEAALRAGANCINDVYAFTGPHSWYLSSIGDALKGKDEADYYMDGMKRVAREYAVPVILMHSRGDAGSNTDYCQYSYAVSTGGATVEGVRVELGSKVEKIVKGKGGVRRWFCIVDPGIGFSKSVDGNLEVLRGAKDIIADLNIGNEQAGPNKSRRNPLKGCPLLIGASRKSFLGGILAQDNPDDGPRGRGRKTEPKERGWATAAAVSCAVQQGALVVRVHDVREMMDVVRVGEALWG